MTEESLTARLNRWAGEGGEALNELFPEIYDELHLLARSHLSRSRHSGVTLQPTVLVNEAYLRLSSHTVKPFADRQEFFALASRLIRHILVDHVRRRLSQKRGGDVAIVPLQQADTATGSPQTGAAPLDLLSLNQALERLESQFPAQARVIELRFFGGLTQPEIAETLNLSLSTVERHWSVGKRRLATFLAS